MKNTFDLELTNIRALMAVFKINKVLVNLEPDFEKKKISIAYVCTSYVLIRPYRISDPIKVQMNMSVVQRGTNDMTTDPVCAFRLS